MWLQDCMDLPMMQRYSVTVTSVPDLRQKSSDEVTCWVMLVIHADRICWLQWLLLRLKCSTDTTLHTFRQEMLSRKRLELSRDGFLVQTLIITLFTRNFTSPNYGMYCQPMSARDDLTCWSRVNVNGALLSIILSTIILLWCIQWSLRLCIYV